MSSSYLNLSPTSPRLNLKAHPPPRPPSKPPGSEATPSRVMNSETTTLPMFFSFFLSVRLSGWWKRGQQGGCCDDKDRRYELEPPAANDHGHQRHCHNNDFERQNPSVAVLHHPTARASCGPGHHHP